MTSSSHPVVSSRHWSIFISHPDSFLRLSACQTWWHWVVSSPRPMALPCIPPGMSGNRILAETNFCRFSIVPTQGRAPDLLWIGVTRGQLARLCDYWFSDPGKKKKKKVLLILRPRLAPAKPSVGILGPGFELPWPSLVPCPQFPSVCHESSKARLGWALSVVSHPLTCVHYSVLVLLHTSADLNLMALT